MDSTNNTNDYTKSNSIILDLENSRVKYNNLLTDYKQAITDYVTYLNTEVSNSNYNSSQPSMEIVKNYSYAGTSDIGQINVSTAEECKASCATTKGCTGATFNNSNKSIPTTCFLKGGDSNLSSASINDYAIVPKGKQLLLTVENLNAQLQTVNKDIQTKNKTVEPLYSEQKNQQTTNSKELTDQFNILTEERSKIVKMIKEYTTLDEKQETGNIKISQNYGSFLLLLGISIVIIIFLVKTSGSGSGSSVTPQTNIPTFQRGGELKSTTYYFIFGIFLFIWVMARYGRF